MAKSITQVELEKIKLCAKLAEFAYDSGDPAEPISHDDDKAKNKLINLLAQEPRPRSEEIRTFQRFKSNSWFITPQNQVRWFRSYAYLSHLHSPSENKDRIIVGFRGTWNNSAGTGRWYTPVGMYGPMRLFKQLEIKVV
jgi:hypothetical protein